MAQKRDPEDDEEVFSLHPSDGSFNIKPARISMKKRKTKKKRDVEAELQNTKMDMIQ
ncbi:MAG TPA: hypothetical protein VMC48_02690 [Methanobacterium sp.]|nr:hypothetical protein [Methanobacterium sp.]